MFATYLTVFVTVILQSNAKEKDFRYIVDNGVGDRPHLASNHGVTFVPLPTINDMFRKFQLNREAKDRVQIMLFYESLCPDCRNFDSTQFKETVIKLGPRLDVYTFPYGNAQTVERNGHVEFICQHGPKECYGNKLHACAFDYFQNITLSVCFNSCLMNSTQAGAGSDDAAADVCGHSMGIDSGPIKMCAKGARGTQLLQYYGVESKKTYYNSVPHILINGVKNAGDHFMRDVCRAFKNPPEACNGLLIS